MIATWLSELTEQDALRHTTVQRAGDGELLAQAFAVWGCVEVKTREMTAMPLDFASDLSPHVAVVSNSAED